MTEREEILGETTLRSVLERGRVSFVFQPIFDVGGPDRRVIAAEALVRGPKGTPWYEPAELFAAACRGGWEAELDRACITGALQAASAVPAPTPIFINVRAATLADPGFPVFFSEALAVARMPPELLTLELGESAAEKGMEELQEAVASLCRGGTRLALDDFGRKASNFDRLLSLSPQLVKVDPLLLSSMCHVRYGHAVLRSLTRLCHSLGARLIAEGVETERDLGAAKTAGIDLVQGFLLGEPRPAPFATTGGAHDSFWRPSPRG